MTDTPSISGSPSVVAVDRIVLWFFLVCAILVGVAFEYGARLRRETEGLA